MKNKSIFLFFIFILLSFLLYIFQFHTPSNYEYFTIHKHTDCPNILIQIGDQLYLYNSNKAQIPGVNPIIFQNLEEYTEYLEWQRHFGIKCPILFLQKSYDADGNSSFRIRPNPFDLQAGLPPSYGNSNIQSITFKSPDAMDPNWGGVEYTQALVDSGLYAGNTRDPLDNPYITN